MTAPTIVRRSARVLLPMSIAGAVVGWAASPALAATNLTVQAGSSSVGGSTLHQNATLQVTGTDTATDPSGLSKSRTLTLAVNRPDAGDYQLAPSKSVHSNADGSISGSLDTTCAPWSGSPCADAVNGDYVFTFSDGSNTRTSTVTLQIPPATPSGFTAQNNGTVVTFGWQPNSEPDLMGYDIVDGSGTDVTPGGMDKGSVCDSGGCSVSVDFGSGARGTSRSFQILALRHTSPGSSAAVPSSPSAAQTVTFPAPPTSAPTTTSTGGSGSGTGAGSGGGGQPSTGGGSQPAAGTSGGGGTTTARGSGGQTSRPLTGRPAADLNASLPLVQAGAAPNLPSVLTEVKPLPQGTYKPVLPYGDQTTREAIRTPVAASAPHMLTQLSQVFDGSALWRGLAGAAVLLLLVGHLHAWVQRVDVD